MSNELLITVPDAMARLQVSRTKFYEMAGVDFPLVKIGRATRIPLGALQDWVASRSAMKVSAPIDDKPTSDDDTGAGAGAGL